MFRFHHRPASLLAALAAGAIGAPMVYAQCDIYRPGLPDFDQRRTAGFGLLGLPNNGSAHCVPASAADAIAYINNHGCPELMFGATPNWSSPGTYNAQTALINTLGTLMGTDGGGTNSNGFVNGLTNFFNDRAPGKFIASTIHWSNGVPPSPDMVRSIMSQGGFPLIVRGIYEPEQANPGILHRTGGHIMLARHAYDTCGNSPELGMRDPNTPSAEDQFANSPWAVYREGLTPFNATFRLSNGTTQQRTYWKWSNNWAPQTKLLDGILVIMPTFAVTGTLINGEEAGINIIRPTNLTGPIQVPHTRTVPLPTGGGALCWLEVTPDLASAIVVTRFARQGGGWAGQVSMQDISSSFAFHEGPEFASEIVDTSTSPNGEIYVSLENEHVLLSHTMERIVSIDSRPAILANAFSDREDRLYVLAQGPSGPIIQRYPADLASGPIDETPCPPNVVFSGQASMCLDPSDGSIFCCSERVPVIYRFSYDAAGRLTSQTIPLPAGSAPLNIHAGSPNRLLFTVLDRVVELSRNANGGYTEVADAPFNGYPVGRAFSLATSRDGMFSGPATGPNTSNIADELLASVPDCSADFNDDGMVNSQDFFDFLSAFFNQAPRADFNDNGAINSQDFFDFLAAFFRGC